MITSTELKRRAMILDPRSVAAWVGAFARRKEGSAPIPMSDFVNRYIEDTNASWLRTEPESLVSIEQSLPASLCKVWDLEVTATGVVHDSLLLDHQRKGGKECLTIPAATVLNMGSGFNHKELSTAGTITAGSACRYSCTYCSVGSSMFRNPQTLILRILGIEHHKAVIRRLDPAKTLRQQLTFRNGKPRFEAKGDRLVVIMSPIVDPLAGTDFVHEALELTLLILELTNWDVRILTKSALVEKFAEQLPEKYRHRVIFGLSIGIIDDGIGKAVEKMTTCPSRRLRAYHWLQENGFRTYSMPCPVLPQADYRAYAGRLAESMNWAKDEQVWCEALNARGKANKRTIEVLHKAGFTEEARLLADATRSQPAWEFGYNRKLFEAMAEVCPPGKLRYLVYAKPQHRDFWLAQRDRGAVVLGKEEKLSE